MDETVIVVMTKDVRTGFLEKELLSFRLMVHEELLVNIFALEAADGWRLCMKVSTGRDVEDWQFDAIYDYYDTGVFVQAGAVAEEEADCHNPTWALAFACPDNLDDAGRIVADLLRIHADELAAVYETIQHQEEAYSV